jgi:predicted polyphosphate/ATP-dependent NAD kinase
MPKKIGFILNPIAGMGGAVGLKGTDTQEILREARSRGAQETSDKRAQLTFDLCKDELIRANAQIYTCSALMGESILRASGLENRIDLIYRPQDGNTTSKDTKQAATILLEEGMDLIVFCGGDGTARDICEIISTRIPILGIPAGVKMHSGVFAASPSACAGILKEFLLENVTFDESEVMDIDEEAYRNGRLDVRLYGIAKVPSFQELMQASKSVIAQTSQEISLLEIADYFKEIVEGRPDTLFFLGAGSTVGAIKKELGIEPTLLGIDAYLKNEQIGRDLNEKGILEMIRSSGARSFAVCVSPIGSQGFILGRGSQQFSPQTLAAIGMENLFIVATPEKLEHTPQLRVDTGDLTLDKAISGFRRVIIGFRTQRMVRVVS